MPKMEGYVHKVESKVKISNNYLRCFLAEFAGTFVLVTFGCGSLAQHNMGNMHAGLSGFNNFHSVCAAWGLAIAMGVWVSGGVSGGHINPAVSLAMCLLGKINVISFFVYMAAQYLGAILGSACVYGAYIDGINKGRGPLGEVCDFGLKNTTGPCKTAGIWATFPQDYMSPGISFVDQLISCTLIMMCILAITDDRNQKPPKGMVPFCIGMVFFVVGLSFGINCGFPVNPARDLGPRIFLLMAGYGTEPFSYNNYNYFWIPIVGPHVGMIVGACMYQLLIGFHWPDEDEDSGSGSGEYTVEVDEKAGYDADNLPPADYNTESPQKYTNPAYQPDSKYL